MGQVRCTRLLLTRTVWVARLVRRASTNLTAGRIAVPRVQQGGIRTAKAKLPVNIAQVVNFRTIVTNPAASIAPIMITSLTPGKVPAGVPQLAMVATTMVRVITFAATIPVPNTASVAIVPVVKSLIGVAVMPMNVTATGETSRSDTPTKSVLDGVVMRIGPSTGMPTGTGVVKVAPIPASTMALGGELISVAIIKCIG